MVTSHGSKPARWKAAAISRSPLEPSSRRIATGIFAARSSTAGAVAAGRERQGVGRRRRVRRPACSCATQAGSACSRSSSKLVASQQVAERRAGRRRARARRRRGSAPRPSARVRPIATHGTSCVGEDGDRLVEVVGVDLEDQAQLLGEQHRERVGPRSSVRRSTSSPQSPANAISSSVVTSPPSERSWPARDQAARRSAPAPRRRRGRAGRGRRRRAARHRPGRRPARAPSRRGGAGRRRGRRRAARRGPAA